MTEIAGEAVPASQRGSWTSFLKSIASFSGDLSSMTAPPFILSPVSLTEFPAYWCEHPELFAAIADFPGDAPGRALAVLRWFVATLKGQYTSRNESMGSEKKPLNPVLGELFYGQWPAIPPSRGRTALLVEQVSHHPPITAYVIENKEKGLRLHGHNAQKTSFSAGSIIVKQIGHAILTVALPGGTSAEYLITFPRLRIDGLWYGSPYIELAETSHIIGGGHVTTIEYKGKGYFSGKSHSFKAVVAPAPGAGGSSTEFHIEGTWHLNSKLTKGTHPAFSPPSHPHSSSKKATDPSIPPGEFFHDMDLLPKEEVSALAASSSSAPSPNNGNPSAPPGLNLETRTLWSAVAHGIRTGDFDTAAREKGRIEVEQRGMRVKEKEEGREWVGAHFERGEGGKRGRDVGYERLAKLVKTLPPAEETYVFKENWPAVFAQ